MKGCSVLQGRSVTEPRIHDENEKKKVLFFVPYGAWKIHNIFDAVLSAVLRLRGADCAGVACDGVFQEKCYVLAHSGNPSADCAACARTGSELFQAFNLPLYQLREAIVQDDIAAVDAFLDRYEERSFAEAEFQGLKLGEWTSPAVCSYYRVSPSSLADEPYRALQKFFCRAAYLSYRALGRIVDHYKPSHIVTLNGNGFLHGPTFALARDRGIDIIIHESAWTEESYTVFLNEQFASFAPLFDLNEAWKNVPLLEPEFEALKENLFQRESGKGSFRTFYDFTTEHDSVRQQLNIPCDAKLVGFFSSSEFELIYNKKEFANAPSQLEILESLIEIFRDRPEYLVVRHHPFIGGFTKAASGRPDYGLQTRLYQLARNAPKNVRIIMPNEKLTSYALLWSLDACIAPYSTIGLEATIRGIPTGMIEEIPLGKAAGHLISSADRSSVESLVDKLLAYASTFGVADLLQAYRNIYSIYYRAGRKFATFHNSSTGDLHVKLESTEALAEGKDPEMDRIADYILKGEPFYAAPGALDMARSTDEEYSFLAREWERIKGYRANLKTRQKPPRLNELNCEIVRLRRVDRSYSRENFSEWYGRSRQKAMEVRQVFIKEIGVREQLEVLYRTIKEITQPLVLFADDDFYYDESVLSYAANELESSSSVDGVFYGAWLTTRDWSIVSSAFSLIEPLASLDGYERHPYTARVPLWILSLGIFRREALMGCILKARSAPSDSIALSILYSFVFSSSVARTERPMILVPEYRGSECEDFRAGEAHRNLPSGDKPNMVASATTIHETTAAQSLLQEAIDALNQGNPSRGREILNDMLKTFDQTPDLMYLQAVADAQLGRYSESVQWIVGLLELDPGHQPGRDLLEQLKTLPH